MNRARTALHCTLTRIVAPLLTRLHSYAQRKLGRPIEYRGCGVAIALPSDHMHPVYRKRYRLHDRFLPHLVRFLNSADTVIDVDANVGDTVAAMAGINPAPNYICIEPGDTFYRHLKTNIDRTQKARPDARIQAIRALVGQNLAVRKLEGRHGTKRAIIGQGNPIILIPLDDLA